MRVRLGTVPAMQGHARLSEAQGCAHRPRAPEVDVSFELIEVDCCDHGDLLARGHVDIAEFKEAVSVYGYEPKDDEIQRGHVRVMPSRAFGFGAEFDTIYRPCPGGGRGAMKVTAFCGKGTCLYALDEPARPSSAGPASRSEP